MNAIRLRLLLFAVIGAVAVAYAGARYARLTDAVYSPTYAVTVELTQTGGLFEGAEVTYRGVPVGRVDDLRLTSDSVHAVLKIDDDAEIPADVHAAVRNRSAVGEQYLDLAPDPAALTSAGEPALLEDGSRIPRSVTSTPLGEEELLANVDRFVTSVDRPALRVVIRELGHAFEDADVDLRRILDGSEQLVDEATEGLDATQRLLRSGLVVLRTQARHGDDLRRISGDLRLLSETLVMSDRELRAVLRDGGPAAAELAALVGDLGPLAPRFLANTLPYVEVVAGRLDGVEQALIAFPYSLAAAQVGVRDGQAQFSLAATPSPTPCQVGYLPPDEWRSTQDLSIAPPRYDLACREGATNFRGSAHAPR
ncbi:MCE family protein [Nocardioides pelophilus]|uniref:MCE family protein n=1 Tax=Nocardioides pelophilus TaxID=2172019 RepID=UPI001602F525|nr:MlaD family protein [Nocardioides pelophilus]